MADPLSVAASIAGLISITVEAAKFLRPYVTAAKDTPQVAAHVHSEVQSTQVILMGLQNLTKNLESIKNQHAALIGVNQVVTIFTDGVLLYSELNKELRSLPLKEENNERVPLTGRLQWARKEGTFTTLLNRLQSFKNSMTLVLMILQSDSDRSAREYQDQLSVNVNSLLESNHALSCRLITLQDALDARTIASTRTSFRSPSKLTSQNDKPQEPQSDVTTTQLTHTSTESNMVISKFDFEDDLESSRVYRRAQRESMDYSFRSSIVRTRTWSLGISLGDISNISVIALPVCRDDLTNAQHYNFGNDSPTPHNNYTGNFVAIGIDFGTTYSGVSWARSTLPKEVNTITGWPSHDRRGKNEIQVPTTYDIESGKWGYEITPDMVPMKWFKLLLLNSEDITKEEIRNAPQLQQARDILSKSKSNITAVQVVGLYLRNVWDHTYTALSSILDIENQPFRVAITIPALWPAYAHSAMKDAANIAGIMKHRGIGETTLILVQEPEAAALASLFQRNSSPEIQKNESFVMCDAGGGTVDVISYKVVSDHPFRLEECVPGNGKLSGAFQIDQAFESYLRGKAKLRISSLTDYEYNRFFLREWELGAKRSFSNASDQEYYHLYPPGKAYGTVARLRNKEVVAISREEMKGFFNRSLTSIQVLVGDQYKQVQSVTGRPPRKILLVGGLGNSEYVYDVLNEMEMFTNRVIRLSKGWSAVARGAVLRLLQENISSQHIKSPMQQLALGMLPDVMSYRSRYHYGISANVPITKIKLDPEDTIVTDPEGVKVTSRMNWYLFKGDKIEKGSRIPILYYQFYCTKDPLPPKCTFDIMYSADDKAPKRLNSGVLDLCRIECDWDKPITEWQAVGDPSKGWKKHNDLEVTMGLEGEPKWEVRVGSKKREHKFSIEYVN